MIFSECIRKKNRYFILLLVLLVGLTGCTQVESSEGEEEESLNLKAYFPLHQGMEYSYAGEGIEFAPFTRKIMYVEDNYLQLTDDNGGTVVVKIYRLNTQEINEVYSKGGFYGHDNLIPEIRETEDKGKIILKTPLEKGNSWNSNDQEYEIVAIDQKLEVPAGIFYQVIKVKISYQESNNTGYEYFAPNIGLIKTEYIGESFTVKSELQAFRLNNKK